MLEQIFNTTAGLALPVLHKMDPEEAHNATLWALGKGFGPRREPPRGPGYRIFGRELRSRVGVAGGMEKNALALPAWRALGFGLTEVGTVTLPSRIGNAKPRLWRVGGSGLVNYMGLNGRGAVPIHERVKTYRTHGGGDACVGVSIGTPDGKPEELASMTLLFRDTGDYIAYSGSCPNVGHAAGENELETQCANIRMVKSHAGPTPVLVKLPPVKLETDAEVLAFVRVVRAYVEAGADGFIACNTAAYGNRTVLAGADRPRVWPTKDGVEVGGYSGPGLYPVMLRMIQILREAFPELILIGVGGINWPYKAVETLQAGASLVQGYTGFTYRGPRLLWAMNDAVAEAGLMKAPVLAKAA